VIGVFISGQFFESRNQLRPRIRSPPVPEPPAKAIPDIICQETTAEALGLKPSKFANLSARKRWILPKSESPHLAFLFLTRGNLNHPRIWEEYLNEHPSRYDLFVHPKNPKAVNQELIKDHVIDDLEETAWGDISLVKATLNLLRAAFANPKTTHFILCSENCLPIKPLGRLLQFLMLDGRSMISHMSIEEMEKINTI